METWQQARLRQKARSCGGEATFLPRFPSACEDGRWRRAQKHKCFGKIMALLLAKTLEGIAKVETQSLLRQNKYLIWCCLYLSHLRLRFFASFVPSSPHLASDLHQKKPAKLPSSLPQQHPDEGLHSVLWPVTLCSSDQEGRPVCNRIFFCCSFILCCNFLAISALPFFVLSLSYFETGTGSGCAVHRNHAGYPPSSGWRVFSSRTNHNYYHILKDSPFPP